MINNLICDIRLFLTIEIELKIIDGRLKGMDVEKI